MNKSMLVGIVAGVGVATAGGVLGYQFLGQQGGVDEQGSNVAVESPAPQAQSPQSAHSAALVVVAQAAPRQQPAPRPAAAPKPAAPPAEECWDEEVTVQVDPKDGHQISGTALGAVVGGAIGKDVGDRDITTAAAAAAGAFIGKRIQQRIQENHEAQRTVTTVEHRCAPAGTPH